MRLRSAAKAAGEELEDEEKDLQGHNRKRAKMKQRKKQSTKALFCLICSTMITLFFSLSVFRRLKRGLDGVVGGIGRGVVNALSLDEGL
jgi:hypothetical protein